jgi:uncharacterized protein
MALTNPLLVGLVDSTRVSGWLLSLQHFAGSLRVFSYPRLSTTVWQLMNARQADLALEKHEFAHHLRHRFYLSKGLSIRQRIDAVLHHCEFEARTFGAAYRSGVYRSPGLPLWQFEVDGAQFDIRLCATRDHHWEGDLTVELRGHGTVLCTMSFAYLHTGFFAQKDAEPIILITRNQSGKSGVEQDRFGAHFKHTTPSYFCLAAIAGIALACDMPRLAGISHAAQIAVKRGDTPVSVSSYDEFWRSFQGAALDHQAFAMPLPLGSKPLSDIPSKHRARTASRRKAWSDVTASAAAAIAAVRSQPQTHAQPQRP